MFKKCECGNKLSFLAGTPAHHSNMYCDKCGWMAWATDPTEDPASNASIAEISQAFEWLRSIAVNLQSRNHHKAAILMYEISRLKSKEKADMRIMDTIDSET